MERKMIRVDVDGVSLCIAATYRGVSEDLVLFIHGLGCSRKSFNEALNYDGLKEFSLLLIDLAGFGDSERPESFSYSLENHAKICHRVLNTVPFDRLHIVAHSMGGAIGLLLSIDRIKRLLSFANIEGNLIGADCGLISRETSGVSYVLFQRELFPRYEVCFSDNQKYDFSFQTVNPLAFYKSAKSLVEWSDCNRLLTMFKALKCKKAYFYGEHNAKINVLKQLKGVRTEEISGSGHFMMNDNPRAFYSKLESFLKETSSKPSQSGPDYGEQRC